MAQMEFLKKHSITTREQLQAYQKPLEEQVLLLIKERQGLYRKEPGAERIARIGEELKPLRKEIRMCVKIRQHSQEIEERMRLAEQVSQEQKQRKEQMDKQQNDRKKTEKERDGQLLK